MTKRVCRDCPIPNCGAKYLVRLSNHLTDVHGLDYINRRKWLQEAKLQPEVRVMIYPTKRTLVFCSIGVYFFAKGTSVLLFIAS